jgi:hypothetical protein
MITLPARSIGVRDYYDVIVAGGGLGGVSAAVAAGKAGAKTLLVERNGFLGGVATAGMCSSVYNCFYTPSHEQVVQGNSALFVNRLAEATGYGKKWHDHLGHIIFDTEIGKKVLSDLLEENNVDYLLDTLVTDVIMDGNTLKGLVIDNKSGKQAVLANVIVDATGDSDVAALAGASFSEGSFVSSYVFRFGNVNVEQFVHYFKQNSGLYPDYMDVNWTFDDAYRHFQETGTFLFPHGGAKQLDIINSGIKSGEYQTTVGVHDDVDACQMHAVKHLGVVHVITGFTKIKQLDINEITRAITDGRRMAYHVAGYFKKHIPGFENSCVIATADDLGIRASRWIKGSIQFTREMKEKQTTFRDSIGKGVVEHHIKKHKGKNAWRAQVLSNETYDIPYRCLVPQKIDGLLMGAGRSVSQENPFLLRVMAMTMVVGQGAGAAAALASHMNVQPRNLNIQKLQKELVDQGVNV